jgi:hypothetical protein
MTFRVVAMLVFSAIVVFASTGCAMHVQFFAGSDAQTWVDHDVGDMVAAYQPQLDVGPAHCPFLISLNSGGRCTVPVNGRPLRVDVVAARGQNPPMRLQAVDAVFVVKTAEAAATAALRRTFAADFTVRCPGKPVQIRSQPVECAATGPDGLRKPLVLDLRGYTGAAVVRTDLGGYSTAAERIFGVETMAQHSGTLTVAGPAVERYIAATSGLLLDDDETSRHHAAPRCPARITVRDGRKASCTLHFGTSALPYEVRFDEGRGLLIEADHQALDVIALDRLVRVMAERRARRLGHPVAYAVSCASTDVVVVEPGEILECTATPFGGKATLAAVSILDRGGDFRMYQRADAEAAGR